MHIHLTYLYCGSQIHFVILFKMLRHLLTYFLTLRLIFYSSITVSLAYMYISLCNCPSCFRLGLFCQIQDHKLLLQSSSALSASDFTLSQLCNQYYCDFTYTSVSRLFRTHTEASKNKCFTICSVQV